MKSLLKFITCGSLDDGKSTLIGHMLYESKLIFADQKRALELDSKVGSNGGEIDYSLLLDGLMAEREQGITIDVAYRYFTTSKRSFIVADCPGHEQYTRNMAVGASFADAAVILIDATSRIQSQTRRHARICALMGIKHIILAVNKMDLVDYDQHCFNEIVDEFMACCAELLFRNIEIIPVSATIGDNITSKSVNMPWYTGQALLTTLEQIEIANQENSEKCVMPVQRVCRPNSEFRGFQGQIEFGGISVGDEITVLPNNEIAKVKKILVAGVESASAIAGQPVTICLDREVEVSRGSIFTNNYNLYVSTLFSATVLWMDEKKLVEGRNYIIKCGTQILPATMMRIKYKLDINTEKHITSHELYKNEIAEVEFSLPENMCFDEFANNQSLGSFILIDRISNMTSACGIINHDLRRSNNVVWQETVVTRNFRANHKHQKPITIWFTGLSGSGKSTIANALEMRLTAMNKHTMLLDGDNIRHGLNNNLGFTGKDRIENIRRISEVAKLMNDAGLIVITAFISPYREDRENAIKLIGDDNFIEVYVSTSLEECEKRDVKGLYKKARNNEIPNFTGISSPYEIPASPEVVIDTTDVSITEAIDFIINKIYGKIT